MKKILMISILLLSGAFIFNACDDEEDYNWDKYEPVLKELKGSTSVRGGDIVKYMATTRGGSTYNFTAEGAIDELIAVEDEPFSTRVDFAESYDDQEAILTVVETINSGNSSNPVSMTIEVGKLDINVVGKEVYSVIEDNPIERKFTVDYEYIDATYEWTVTGNEDYFEIIEGANSKELTLKFLYPDVDMHTINLAVEVTTRKGNPINDNMDIDILQFCPLIIDDMLGNWVGDLALSEGACPQTAVVVDVDEEETTITLEEITDFLTICVWGEDWDVMNGLKLYLDEPDGLITIPMQYYAQSNYPDYYFIRGVEFEEGADYHGEYNFCEPYFTIKYEVLLAEGVDEDGNPVDGDGNPVEPEDLWNPFGGALTSTFTLATKSNSVTILPSPIKK